MKAFTAVIAMVFIFMNAKPANCGIFDNPFLESLKKNSTEVVSMRTEYSKTFFNKDGTFTCVMVADEPFHFLDSNKTWQERNIAKYLSKPAATQTDTLEYEDHYPYIKNPYYNGSTYGEGAGNQLINCYNNYDIHRQIFRWDPYEIYTFHPDAHVLDSYYTVHASDYQPSALTFYYFEKQTDPLDWQGSLQYLWLYDWGTCLGSQYVSSEDVYPLDLVESDVENFILNEKFYAVGHRLDDSGKTVDICSPTMFVTYSCASRKPAALNFAAIHANPNPFNPITTISYSIPYPCNVKIEVFSVNGQKVATLVSGMKEAGNHSVIFDGKGVASGVYVYRMTAGNIIRMGKLMLVK